ncbi:hypothetical protein CO2235_MP10259 [Cupriavidus oxalaticus]|uniref:Uncharacterized protein n=1 Tax=Cupriavidus oxalaticus TaxID=96344 RepID=A0A375GEU1_9BURK|nr:hypothetical protein CO2235_U1010172 [Cupriavidus oxalaticus]SPC17943.1 hypothetical protein CO2235_MP10259 [Cupriavidus oxalaticus]
MSEAAQFARLADCGDEVFKIQAEDNLEAVLALQYPRRSVIFTHQPQILRR